MTKDRNVKLNDAMFRAGINQKKLAEKSGLHRSYLSLHINGRWIFTDAEKQSIAEVLGQPVSELFQERMPSIKEITDLEQAFFELEKIKAQVNALSDFLMARIRNDRSHKPKTEGMIDPRTGRSFKDKSTK